MQPQPQTEQQIPQRCLQEIFCENCKCPIEEYEERLFWMCLKPNVILLARIIWIFNRKYFYNDFEMLRQLGRTSNTRELRYEIESFRRNNPPHGFLRRDLKVRVSGRRLLKIASRLFSLETSRRARSIRISQTPSEMSNTTAVTSREEGKIPENQNQQQSQPSESKI